jgi:Lipoprotein amino terminal region
MNQKTIKWVSALVLSACAIGFVWSNYFRYSPATQQTYEFVFKSASTHDLNPLFQGSKAMTTEKQDVRIDFRSKLHKTTVKTQDTLDWVVCSLDAPQLGITVNGNPIGDMDKYILNEDLKKSALVKIDKTGKIVSMATDSSMNPTIDVLWRNILSQMQVVLPENATTLPNDWTTTEEEPMGQYQGRLAIDAEKKATDSAVFVVKEKLGYSRISGEYGNLGKPNISGRYKAAIKLQKKNNSLQSVVVDDLKNLSFGKDTTARSLISFTANYIGQSQVEPKRVSEMMGLFSHKNYALWGKLDSDPSWMKIKQKKCQNILGNETAESLIDSLRKVNASGAVWSDALFQKLQALTYLEPKNCAKLRDVIDEFPPKTVAFGGVINVLALDESDEAQREFAAVVKKYDKNEDALFEILPLISSMKMPSRQVENAVKDLAFSTSPDNITSTAQLAYASIAYRTKIDNPKRANTIVETLIANLKGKAATQQYILALGNTGSEKSLEELKSFLGDPSVETKSLALSNLRLISQPQVDTILYLFATRDTSQVLKKVALETLNFRSSQTVY